MIWRVRLRPAADADAVAVDKWLGEALNAIAGHPGVPAGATLGGLRESLGSGRQLHLVATESGRPVGLIVTARLGPNRSAIDILAVAADDRNLGYGAEAVYVLEGAEPTTNFVAGVPLENGLAIYFWLRIGYAPVFPMPVDGALAAERIWMARGARAAAG